MTKPSRASPHKLASVSVPLFWPMIAAAQLAEQGVGLYYARNLEFLAEEEKLNHLLKPALATPNRAIHGLPHPDGNLAGDRTMDHQFHVTKKIGATKICRHNIG